MRFSPPAHHSEPADPVLLGWITHQIDAVVNMEPQAIVLVLAVVILAIPTVIVSLFLRQRYQRRRR